MREKTKEKVILPQFCTVVAKLCIHTKLENIAKLFSLFSIPGFCYNNGGGDYPDDLASQPLPRIISRGETIRAAFGERVQLPCHVEQLGTSDTLTKSVLLQKRGIFSVIAWLSSN